MQLKTRTSVVTNKAYIGHRAGDAKEASNV